MPQEAVAAPPSLLIREGLHPLAARRPRAELDTAWMRTDASYFALDPDEPAAIHGTAAASGTRTGVQTIRKKKVPESRCSLSATMGARSRAPSLRRPSEGQYPPQRDKSGRSRSGSRGHKGFRDKLSHLPRGAGALRPRRRAAFVYERPGTRQEGSGKLRSP